MPKVIAAYSTTTDRSYVNWDALVATEGNGYCVVSTSERPNTAPVVMGPYLSAAEAKKAQARLRYKWRKEEAPYKVKVHVRVLWQEKPV